MRNFCSVELGVKLEVEPSYTGTVVPNRREGEGESKGASQEGGDPGHQSLCSLTCGLPRVPPFSDLLATPSGRAPDGACQQI